MRNVTRVLLAMVMVLAVFSAAEAAKHDRDNEAIRQEIFVPKNGELVAYQFAIRAGETPGRLCVEFFGDESVWKEKLGKQLGFSDERKMPTIWVTILLSEMSRPKAHELMARWEASLAPLDPKLKTKDIGTAILAFRNYQLLPGTSSAVPPPVQPTEVVSWGSVPPRIVDLMFEKEQRVKDLEARVKEKPSIPADLERQLREQQEKIVKLEKDLAQAPKRFPVPGAAKDAQIAQLQKQVQEKVLAISDLEKQLREQQAEIKKLESSTSTQMGEKDGQIAQLQEQVQALEKQLADSLATPKPIPVQLGSGLGKGNIIPLTGGGGALILLGALAGRISLQRKKYVGGSACDSESGTPKDKYTARARRESFVTGCIVLAVAVFAGIVIASVGGYK